MLCLYVFTPGQHHLDVCMAVRYMDTSIRPEHCLLRTDIWVEDFSAAQTFLHEHR